MPRKTTRSAPSVPTAARWRSRSAAAVTQTTSPMTLGLVQAAVGYHGAFPVEVDERIERNEQVAAEAHSAWLAGQAALRR
jgi:hypothetical protein